MYKIDELVTVYRDAKGYHIQQGSFCGIDNKTVISRPIPPPFWNRVKDAWQVITAKADAICFYKQ